jgi:MutS domain I
LLGLTTYANVKTDDPLQQQYLCIKKQLPDTIVFFRLGDFCETFNNDAKIVSSVGNIVRTGREMGTGNRVPLASVAYHAVDNYLAKLIHAGHKVAIVEQTGTPERVGGVSGRVLETREVARLACHQPSHRSRFKSGSNGSNGIDFQMLWGLAWRSIYSICFLSRSACSRYRYPAGRRSHSIPNSLSNVCCLGCGVFRLGFKDGFGECGILAMLSCSHRISLEELGPSD